MVEFRQIFQDRMEELDAYLDFLENMDQLSQNGIPRLGGSAGAEITPTQKSVLYSSFYLQVYNTIEATIIKCLEGLSNAVNNEGLPISQLIPKLQREWVKGFTKSNDPLNPQNRLDKSMKLFEELLQHSTIHSFSIEKGGGGNWDDKKIESIINLLGWNLSIDQDLQQKIKSHYKEEKGILAYVTLLRNKLAHGSISFVECGKDVAASDLRELKTTTYAYLESVVVLFEDIINNKTYKSVTCAE